VGFWCRRPGVSGAVTALSQAEKAAGQNRCQFAAKFDRR
jgi:hypothetical protein